MKKVLVISILIGSSLGLGSAFATDDSVTSSRNGVESKLEGLFNFQAGSRSQKGLGEYQKNVTRHNKSLGFYTEATLSALVSQQLDEVKYGLQLVVMPTTNIITSGSFNGSHIFLESDYGKVELGSPYDAGSKMRTTIYDVVAATGDDFCRYASLDHDGLKYNGLAPDFSFYEFFLDGKNKSNILNASHDKTEPSRKISYFSPVLADGLQFGISYIPDSSNAGLAKHNASGGESVVALASSEVMKIDNNVKNAFSGGVSYTHQIADGISFKISATGEYGTAAGKIKRYADSKKDSELLNTYKLSDLRSYNIGGVFKYGSFAYALSYGDLGKSLTSKEYHKVGRRTQYYGGAASYSQGAVKTSLSYFRSSHNKNKLEAIVLGSEYKVGSGLVPYAEVTYFQAKGKHVYYPDSKNLKTKGTVFILGTKVKF
jgi:hypothetical protein